MGAKINDFIEIEFTGRLKDGSVVFDTTDAEVARKNNIYSENSEYGPIVVSLGNGQMLKGLEDKLVGKEPGSYTFELDADHAFGKKDAKLIQLVPAQKFLEQGINPVVGLRVAADQFMGVVRAVSGGRITIDFNHPLAGKDVVYEVKFRRFVTDAKEKLVAIARGMLGIKKPEVEVNGNNAKLFVHDEIPDNVREQIEKRVKELTGLNISLELYTGG